MKISVITSTYREYGGGELQRAISSLRAQTHKDWELVIVGDASPYEREIKHLIATLNDKRIAFVNLKKRAGISSPGTVPKIRGVELSSGELIAFLDADNTYFPNHLELCVKAFQNDPTLDLVYGNTKIVNSKFFSFTWKKPDWTPKRAKLLMYSNFLDMSEPVFTRTAYNAGGGLSTAHHAADWILWKAMLQTNHAHFKHLNHLGLTYYTSALTQHISYFFLMLAQRWGVPYHSMRVPFIQWLIKRRHRRKY